MKKLNVDLFKAQGYAVEEFCFDNRACVLVIPNHPRSDGKWLFKTEYFGAFPNFEFEMLKKGYYVAHMQSTTRWCPEKDTVARAAFCEYLTKSYGLSGRCMPVGLSCGGMQAVYLAAKYPQLIGALYLDAPVMNLLSCPCGMGLATNHLYEEFYQAMGITVSDLLNYRSHPVDFVDALIENRIPVALVCGDSDTVVPYVENGVVLAAAYRKTDIPFFEVLKPGCDHHPHGLDDLSELLAFAEKYYH